MPSYLAHRTPSPSVFSHTCTLLVLTLITFAAACSNGGSIGPDGTGGTGGTDGTVDPTRGVNAPKGQSQAIVNGEPTDAAYHQAVVSLHQKGSNQIFCSGTLITPEVVLTAAHCLHGSGFTTDPAYLQIYVGDNPTEDALPRFVDVIEVGVHPEYDEALLRNDIGLLRLAESVDDIDPVPALPASLGFTDPDLGALSLNFAGFGETENGTYNQKLQATGMTESFGCGLPGCDIVPGDYEKATQISYSQPDSGPCYGDSGGPAFVERDGAVYVGGMTSYGDESCTEFGVSTRADAYEAFIQAFVEGESDTGDTETVVIVEEGLSGVEEVSQVQLQYEIPANATRLTFSMSGGTGDADLYVAFGRPPTTGDGAADGGIDGGGDGDWDCRPYYDGNDETCAFFEAQEGTYYVLLHPYADFDGVTLTVSYDIPAEQGADERELTLLEFLNSPETTFAVLDDDVVIDGRAAQNLIDHRDGPDGIFGTDDDDLFNSIEEVDSVPWVGPATLSRLIDYALAEASPEGKILDFLNSTDATFEVLVTEVGLDDRAADRIILYREGPDGLFGTDDDNLFNSLDEVDDVPWVGSIALAKLTLYVAGLDEGGDECIEGPEDSEAACSDGCSNDGDAWIDCDDYDCSVTTLCGACEQSEPEDTEAACSDGCSNDGDRWTDCDDYDCKDTVVCGAPGPVCGDGVVEGNEECDDGNTVDGDGCSSYCTLEVVAGCGFSPATSTDFRVDTIALNFPPIGPNCTSGLGPIAEDLINAAICSDGDLPSDGELDINLLMLLGSIVDGVAGIGSGSCGAPGTGGAVDCTYSDPAIVAGSSRTSEDCEVAIGSTSASVPAGSYGCVELDVGAFVLELGVLSIPLGDVKVIAQYNAEAPTELVNGTILGAITVEDAYDTLIPADVPAVGGQPLGDLLCEDDAQVLSGESTYVFELGFKAIGVFAEAAEDAGVDECINAADADVYDSLDTGGASGEEVVTSISANCIFPDCGSEAAAVLGSNTEENRAALAACVVECTETQAPLSMDCLNCYGVRVACGAAFCAGECIADVEAPACIDCLDDNCAYAFDVCTGL